MQKIETSKILLVDLRLQIKDFGIRMDSEMPKALVIYNEEDNKYHNIITPEETYPLINLFSEKKLEQLKYGTELVTENVNQNDETRMCAILSNDKFIEEIKENTYIEMKDLEDKMLYSSLYFKDRIRIIEKRINNSIRVSRKLRKLVSKDWEKNCNYQDQIFFIRDERKKLIKK